MQVINYPFKENKLKLFIFLLVGTFLLISGCRGEDPKRVKGCNNIPKFKDDLKNDTKLNINVLIDISYRIAKNTDHGKNVVDRDLAIIKQLGLIWKKHICRKSIRAYNDEFSIRVNEPMPNGLKGYFKKLKFNIEEIYQSKNNASFKNFLSHFEDTLTQRTKKIYQKVYDKGYESEEDWIGSNIYGFFNNSNQIQKCIDKNAKNVLIVLTDGYISHTRTNKEFQNGMFNNLVEYKFQDGGEFYKMDLQEIKDKGYGLKPTKNQLSNLEVIFAGIDPHVNATDSRKIKYFLNNWLKSMDVEEKAIFESKKALVRNKEDFKNYFYQQ